MGDRLGLEGVFNESDMSVLSRRTGMADWDNGSVKILNRRLLPHKVEYLKCDTVNDVARAIKNMNIQGAYSISIAAGYGLALAAKDNNLDDIKAAAALLRSTRPTGLALGRMMDAALVEIMHHDDKQTAIINITDKAAAALARQGHETGRLACDLIPDGATILTHCFPDRSYAYLLLEARKQNKKFNIIASETRPYLQGARLTALVANEMGFNTKVATDGMGGYLIRSGMVSHFLTAADRVCMDGTVCNKIGTYPHALACADNDKPYIVLRQSGPDLKSATEDDIEVEMRDGQEVVEFLDHSTAPKGVEGLYPSFDIIPPRLVSKIITDRGAFAPEDISKYSDAPIKIKGAIV